MEEGIAAIEFNHITDYERKFGRWHRSKDKKHKPDTDYASYINNKKWWLEEQFNVHMMRFQQVECICY